MRKRIEMVFKWNTVLFLRCVCVRRIKTNNFPLVVVVFCCLDVQPCCFYYFHFFRPCKIKVKLPGRYKGHVNEWLPGYEWKSRKKENIC